MPGWVGDSAELQARLPGENSGVRRAGSTALANSLELNVKLCVCYKGLFISLSQLPLP